LTTATSVAIPADFDLDQAINERDGTERAFLLGFLLHHRLVNYSLLIFIPGQNRSEHGHVLTGLIP